MVSVAYFAALFGVEIYPREGTETIASWFLGFSCVVEIYPREGTETICSSLWIPPVGVEIYPREGTETSRDRNDHNQ